MKLKNIESKIRLTMFVAIGSWVLTGAIVSFTIIYAFQFIDSERDKIYVLDNGTPVLVNRVNVLDNREVEYKKHVELFHNLFFTLPPDDDFIKQNIDQAMYLVDESGLTQYNNLKENSYYNQIISSSSVLSILKDSVKYNPENKSFEYRGIQRIDRKTTVVKRELITTGFLKDVPRTINNPHGVIITKWKTKKNEDLSNERKKQI